MEVRKWEQRNSEVALHESHRELECQRLQLCQANTWADNAHRESVVLCGELERRNNLFQEDGTKHCREIAELRSRCSEESDKVQQAKMDELSMTQQKNLHTVSQLYGSNQRVAG